MSGVDDLGCMVGEPLPRAFYEQPTLTVARHLIGKTFARRTEDGLVAGMIVETEGYISAVDPAAHAYRGKTPSNATMFGQPGHIHVYFTYGMHYCVNVVTEAEGTAGAVLIRAIQPCAGIALMQTRRGERITERDLARGPGRLCAAFALTTANDGTDLLGDTLWICEPPTPHKEPLPIAVTPRVGITQAVEWPWRFVLMGNPYVSAKGVKKPAGAD